MLFLRVCRLMFVVPQEETACISTACVSLRAANAEIHKSKSKKAVMRAQLLNTHMSVAQFAL